MSFVRNGEKSFSSYSKKERSGETKSEIFQSGDIVLLRDGDLIRNKCPMEKFVETFKNDNGNVRSFCLKVGQSKLNKICTILE